MSTTAGTAGELTADPGSQNRPKFRSRLTLRWIVIIGVLLFVGFCITIVMLNEELRREYWVQKLIALLLVLGVTVVLFGVFKNVANVQMPLAVPGSSVPVGAGGIVITLAGAAAFFYLLLGPISNFLFPPDQTVAGYIFYKRQNPDEGLMPVPNVQVRVPQTYQSSAPTSNDGRFVITNLTFHPSSLDAIYSNTVYDFRPTDPAGRYPIIPRPAGTAPPPTASIAGTEWVEVGTKCPDSNTRGYRSVKLMILQKTVPTVPGYTTMVFKINAQPPVQIVDAQKELPQNAGLADQLTDAATVARQWSIPLSGDKAEIKFAVCLGNKAAGPPPPRNSLSATYSFK